MNTARFHAALAADGVTAVLHEVVHAAWEFAAQGDPRLDYRPLYEFAALLEYEVRKAENLNNAENA